MTQPLSRFLAKTLVLTACVALLAVNFMSGCNNQAPQDASSQPTDLRDETDTAAKGQATPGQATSEPDVVDSPHYPLPTGGGPELVQFLNEMGMRDPAGATVEEENIDRERIMEARILASERLLDHDDDAFHPIAAEVKLESLRILNLFGNESAAARYDAFADELLASAYEPFQRIGRMAQLRREVDRLRAGEIESAVVADHMTAALADEKTDTRLFYVVEEAAQAIRETADRASATELLKKLGETFAGNENPQLAARAQEWLDELELDRLHQLVPTLASGDSEDENAEVAAALIDGVTAILNSQHVGNRQLQSVLLLAQRVEAAGNHDVALPLYTALGKALEAGNTGGEVPPEIAAMSKAAEKRLALVGQKLQIEGQLANGESFDWSTYRGKVTLIDFWATWCGPCLREFDNLEKIHQTYRDLGFEIVGINLDDEGSDVQDFLAQRELPWTTIVSQDPNATGVNHPMAVQCGVESIPFLVLVDQDGTVLANNIQADSLEARLAERLGPPTPNEGGEDNDGENKGDNDAGEATEAEKTADPDRGPFSATANPPANEVAQPSKIEASNPYAPPTDLTPVQLADFILTMQDKPKSIQHRQGFREGVVTAANQLMAVDAPDRFQIIAAKAKLKYLHRDACLGDLDADRQLQAAVAALQSDTRPAIAEEIEFFQAKQGALQSADLPPEQIEARLDELKKYFAQQGENLTSRHLRMASATVDLINRLEDTEQREPQFQELAKLLEASSDKALERYGRRIGGSQQPSPNEWIGKPLEIVGTTIEGQAFDWNGYRGQVVLVDFWATWCGPCRAQLPALQAVYEKHQPQGLEIVGISLDEDIDALNKYLAENQMPWAHLAGDGTSELADKHGVRGIPALFLVDREGNVAAAGHRLRDVQEELDRLMAAAKE